MKKIRDYKMYKVTKDGKVWSERSKRFLSPLRRGHYECVTLAVNGKNEHRAIHRLVAEAYIPNPHNKPIVNHIDGNKTNNEVSNLQWTTTAENTQHAYDNGLIDKNVGEQVYGSKLTSKCIDTIFYLKSLGWKQYKIAEEMDVSRSRISEILNKKSWRHLHEQK